MPEAFNNYKGLRVVIQSKGTHRKSLSFTSGTQHGARNPSLRVERSPGWRLKEHSTGTGGSFKTPPPPSYQRGGARLRHTLPYPPHPGLHIKAAAGGEQEQEGQGRAPKARTPQSLKLLSSCRWQQLPKDCSCGVGSVELKPQ